MTKIFTYILTSLLALLATVLFAQEKTQWSLEDCILYGYEHNIQLQRQQKSLAVHKNNLQQSKNNRLPSLNGSASYNNSYGRGLDGTTNTYTNKSNYGVNYGIGASVDLFGGFVKKHRIHKNEIDLQAMLYDIDAQKENLALNITSYYLEILYAKEQLEVAKENLAIVEKQKGQMKALVDAGKKPKGDLFEQESQLAKAESGIVNAENKLSTSYLNLYQLLDVKNEEAFEVEVPSENKLNAQVGTLLNQEIDYDKLISSRPAMAALKYRKQSAEQDIKIAKSAYFPTLSLNANVGSSYSSLQYNRELDPKTGILKPGARMPFGKQADVNLSQSWGLSLRVPIFNKFQTRTSVRNSIIQVEDMELQKEEQENKLYKELQQAHTAATSALKKYNAEEKALIAHKETFRYISEKYKLGLISSFDYNQALNNLTVAKSNLLQAKYEYIFRTKIIAFYKGESLKF